jgi:hypothetical protein
MAMEDYKYLVKFPPHKKVVDSVAMGGDFILLSQQRGCNGILESVGWENRACEEAN